MVSEHDSDMAEVVTTGLQHQISQLQKDMAKLESKLERVNEQIRVDIEQGLEVGMLKV